jgi:glycerophosphoryl diester phosphodiesterase
MAGKVVNEISAVGAMVLLSVTPSDVVASEIIAHRGGYAYGPENTIVNFRHALEHGATVIEMDLRRTADGVIVIMHDETVDRTTDGTGPIKNFTLEEAKRLDAGEHWPPPFGGERIPTLEEAMRAVKAEGGKVCLDLKEPFLGQGIRAVVDNLEFAPRDIFCIAYDLGQLDDFVHWLPESRALFIAGGTPRVFMAADLLVLRDRGAAGLMFWYGPFSKDDIDYGHGLGLEIHYMGGAPTNAYYQIELGIDGFGTDWPEACARQYRADAWSDWVQKWLAAEEATNRLVETSDLQAVNADSDADGASNLLEYAVGGNPLKADLADGALGFETNGLGQSCVSLSLRPFKLPHLILTPHVSQDLENWAPGRSKIVRGGAVTFEMPAFEVLRQFVKFEVSFWE